MTSHTRVANTKCEHTLSLTGQILPSKLGPVFCQGLLLFVEPRRICQALSIPRDKMNKGRMTGTLEKQFGPILPIQWGRQSGRN
jgi:hypothetical protein